VLHHAANRKARLLNGAQQGFRLSLRVDHLGNPLEHGFAIEQQQPPLAISRNMMKNEITAKPISPLQTSILTMCRMIKPRSRS